MGIGRCIIVSCTLSCGIGAIVMWVGTCTLGPGVGTGDVVSVKVGVRGVGDNLRSGQVVAWRIICVI